MYCNPAYYRTTLNMLSLANNPSTLFEAQVNDLQWLTAKRKARLERAATNCKEIFHVGNICTDYELPSSAQETFQELAPLIQNIYRIIHEDHLTCRIVNLFTRAARTLPKNHLRRLYISDLTAIKYFCTSRYLQNVQHKLYRQNKLTSPDQSKTWLQLLRKPSQTHIDIPYCTEDINKDE